MHRSLTVAAAIGAILALSSCSSVTKSSAPADNPSVASSSSPAASPSTSSGSDDDQTGKFGETFTYDDDQIKVSVTDGGKYTPSEYASVDKAKQYRKFYIKFTNAGDERFDPSLAQVSVASGDAEHDQVFDSAKGINGAPSTKVRPGKSIRYPVAFGVDDPSDMTVEVTPDFSHEAVVFSNN